MDPTACCQWMLDAISDGDYEEAAECAENLIEWLQKGGFRPRQLEGLGEHAVLFCEMTRDYVREMV